MCLLSATVGALLGIGWYATERLEEKVLAARLQTLETSISILAEQGFRRFGNTQQGLADSGIYAGDSSVLAANDAPGRRALLGMLQRHPNMTAGFVGFADGSFLYVAQVERLAEARRQEIGAPEGAVTVTRVISGDGYERLDGWIFEDAGGKELSGKASTLPDYDPRQRRWFKDAVKAGQPIITEPYVFTGAGGITVATRLPGGQGVIGADLTLTIVSRLLNTYKISPSSLIMVTTDSGAALGRSDLPTAPAQSELADWMLAEIRNLARGRHEGMVATRQVGGVDIRLQARALTPVFDRRLFLAVAAPMPELTAETGALIARSAMVAVAAVVIAFVGGVVASRLLSGPLGRIADKTDQFRQLDFSDVGRVDSRVSEINRLETAVEHMRGGLEQFGRYVPRQLVRRVIESPTGATVGGTRQAVTVMFTDIEHFSTTAETMDPEQLMARLSKYLQSLGGAMVQHGGTIDKYIGDSIMAIWNAPDPDADHVAKACRAALAAARASEWLEKKWEQRGREAFRTRCGLHTGVAVVGNVAPSMSWHARIRKTVRAGHSRVRRAQPAQGLEWRHRVPAQMIPMSRISSSPASTRRAGSPIAVGDSDSAQDSCVSNSQMTHLPGGADGQGADHERRQSAGQHRPELRPHACDQGGDGAARELCRATPIGRRAPRSGQGAARQGAACDTRAP